MYLEDDGGPRLLDGLAACAQAGVRVAVLKVGTSAAGAQAAAAHSGALAGDQRVFNALLAEAGAEPAEDLHELLEVAKAMAARRPPRSKPAVSADSGGLGVSGGSGSSGGSTDTATGPTGLAILTCSGGDSAQGADEAARQGLALPGFAPATCKRLRELLPPAATVANPLDYTAMIWGDAEALEQIVIAVASDPAIDQLLVFYDQPRDLDPASEQSWAAVREGLIAGAARVDEQLIVSSTLPELLDDAAAWRFASHGIAPVAGLRAGLRCAAALRSESGDPQRLHEITATGRETGAGDGAGVWLSEHDSKQLLAEGGVTVPAGRLVVDADDATLALAELGARLVLKLSSAKVQHKTELGGVELGLTSEADVRRAYERLATLAAAHGGAVLAEQMAAGGTELLVAARADTIVPVLVIGLGGIWTELLDDVAIVPLPASTARIERALRSLHGAPLFAGGRGLPAADIAAAAALIERSGELLINRGLELIELNPVLLGSTGCVALDASIRVATTAASPLRSGPPDTRSAVAL
jgi:acetyl-CoA synthetase